MDYVKIGKKKVLSQAKAFENLKYGFILLVGIILGVFSCGDLAYQNGTFNPLFLGIVGIYFVLGLIVSGAIIYLYYSGRAYYSEKVFLEYELEKTNKKIKLLELAKKEEIDIQL